MSLNKIIGECAERVSKLPAATWLEPKPKVAVIRLSGIIADGAGRRHMISFQRYQKLIEQAFDVHKLQAVALVINSPGGSAAQSALIGARIRKMAEKKEIPVYAFIEDVAASGGYWLACAADEIYGTDVSIVGSVGVISAGFGFQDFIGRYGVERRVHTSGKEKSFLDPFQPEKPEDVKRLKGLQGDLHESFKDWVRARRGEKLTAADKDIFEGQIWTAPKAKDLGIIDGIGDLHAVCEEKHGEDIKLLEFVPERSWVSSLFGDLRLSLADGLIESAEERAMWARYGL